MRRFARLRMRGPRVVASLTAKGWIGRIILLCVVARPVMERTLGIVGRTRRDPSPPGEPTFPTEGAVPRPVRPSS